MRSLRRGFSLVELMIVIAITSILYIETPDIIGSIEGPKGNRALADAQMIATGLWGLNEDSNAFAGDLGFVNGIPGTFSAMNDLAFPPPASQYAPRWNFAGVSGGWNGPYVGFQPQALQFDPWGTPWSFTSDGRVHSNGADTISGTADDIYVPACQQCTSAGVATGPFTLGTTGTLAVTVRDPNGILLEGLNNVQFTVSNPNPQGTGPTRGVNAPLSSPTSGSGTPDFVFAGLQPGQHGIQINGIAGGGNCNGMALASPRVIGGTTTAVNTCSGLLGHAIGFVGGGTNASVTVRLQ